MAALWQSWPSTWAGELPNTWGVETAEPAGALRTLAR